MISLCTGRSRVRFPVAGKIFLSASKRPDRLWSRPSILLNGYPEFLSGAKRPGRENGPSSASNAEVDWHTCTQRQFGLLTCSTEVDCLTTSICSKTFRNGNRLYRFYWDQFIPSVYTCVNTLRFRLCRSSDVDWSSRNLLSCYVCGRSWESSLEERLCPWLSVPLWKTFVLLVTKFDRFLPVFADGDDWQTDVRNFCSSLLRWCPHVKLMVWCMEHCALGSTNFAVSVTALPVSFIS
jgi:hypothetical protein